MTAERCPATTRHGQLYTAESVGVQCKYAKGHDGDHAGYPGSGTHDIFWPQGHADGALTDEDRIRDAMAEAADCPGRIVTR